MKRLLIALGTAICLFLSACDNSLAESEKMADRAVKALEESEESEKSSSWLSSLANMSREFQCGRYVNEINKLIEDRADAGYRYVMLPNNDMYSPPPSPLGSLLGDPKHYFCGDVFQEYLTSLKNKGYAVHEKFETTDDPVSKQTYRSSTHSYEIIW